MNILFIWALASFSWTQLAVGSFELGNFTLSELFFNYKGKNYVGTSANIEEIFTLINAERKSDYLARTKRSHVAKIRKRSLEKFVKNHFDFEFSSAITIVGPKCIPLKSKNVLDNPYHASLLSREGTDVRYGLGMPQILEANPLFCPKNHPDSCSFGYNKQYSTSVTNSYSISLGHSETFSNSMGTTNSKGKTNSIAKSIGNSLERGLSKTLSLSNEESLSDQVSDSLTNSHESSSGVSRSKSREVSETDSFSQDVSKSDAITTEWSLSNAITDELSSSNSQGGGRSKSRGRSEERNWHSSSSISVGAGFDFFGMSGSVEASYTSGRGGSTGESTSDTEETNWANTFSNSKGKN